jgi:hypothetical protein
MGRYASVIRGGCALRHTSVVAFPGGRKAVWETKWTELVGIEGWAVFGLFGAGFLSLLVAILLLCMEKVGI